MYLKNLEVLGFKSFADRTEFSFPAGMTGVVGPNGCGKSNVVDAFKWIFGEQSAKGLRGTEMRDVIFNGTLQRKPTGFAEASVVFDNAQRLLDVDYSEVAITRRLYRSGESDYLINREKCRLKDIKELLLGTGVGRTSYSILEQGKIDVLLQATQFDRRVIFEEAAGISKYRVKKAETLRALARVEDNLTRVQDILEEVSKRVRRLKSQASKARRYRRYTDRLKELRIRVAVDGYRSSVETRAMISGELYWLQFQMDRAEDVFRQLTNGLSTRGQERQQLTVRLGTLREKIADQQVVLERAYQQIEHGRRRQSELEDEKSRKETAVEETGAALERLREEMSRQETELAQLQAAMKACAVSVEESTCGRDELRRRGEELQSQLESGKEELVAQMQVRARLANEIVQLESELKNLRARRERVATLSEECRDQLADEEDKERAEAAKLRELQAELTSLESERVAFEQAASELRERQTEQQAELDNKRQFRQQKESRYEVLSTLESNLEGVGRGAREVLNQQERLDELGDVHGLLASVLQVEHKYACALEAVLGLHAQSFVVETQDGAVGLLDLARSEDVKAVEVLCLDRIDTAALVEFAPHEGVLGPLRDLVQVPDLFSELMDRLLANVLLVEDFDTALKLSRNGLRPLRLVTLQGEVIEPWGALSLHQETEFGLISRRSEMEELEVEVEVLAAEEKESQEALALVEGELAENRRQQEELSLKIAECARGVAQGEEKTAQARRELDRIERELEAALDELDEIEEAIAERRVAKEQQEECVAEVEARTKSCEEATAETEETLTEATRQIEEAEEAVTEARLALAQTEKREEGLRELQLSQEANREEKETLLATLSHDIDGLGKRRIELEDDIAQAQTSSADAQTRLADLRNVFTAEESADRELQSLEQRCQREMTTVRKEIARLQEERESAQLRDQQERHQQTTLYERLDEEYGLDLSELLRWEELVLAAEKRCAASKDNAEALSQETDAEALTETSTDLDEVDEVDRILADPTLADMPSEARFLLPDPDHDSVAALQEVKQLQESMRRMGNVNLEALEELEELEERHSFQLSQREDLVDSAEKLRSIIDEINTKTREMFLRTFEEVQENFSELFRKCFGGGKAELKLEEGVDVLDAGIEIVARPPGKKISSLTLMSGGEKTMTTLALMFAIFKAHPCPFCLLDEVDAALDDVNVNRFIVLLKEFVDTTQFIVVTHNKATMAEAGTLYGVTMQEPGVSTKVTVELQSYDAEAMERAAAHTES